MKHFLIISFLFHFFCLLPCLAEVTPVPEFNDDLSLKSLESAIKKSLHYLEKNPKGATAFDNYNISKKEIRYSLRDILKKLKTFGLSKEFYDYLKTHYELLNISPDLKLTAYYEAELHASFVKTKRFKYPIYTVPPELAEYHKKRKKYYSRKEIDYENKLAKRNLELAWTDDPIKLFFMHIQGSGKLILPDKNIIDVQYADNNGYYYKSIAPMLSANGAANSGSSEAVINFLQHNPHKLPTILSYNPRYIFFKQVPRGPIGSLDEKLTPKRSVALDHSVFPKGALFLLESSEPILDENAQLQTRKKFSRFVLNQDSGNAIRGKNRADYFIGYGPLNEKIAGHICYPAKLSLIKMKKEFLPDFHKKSQTTLKKAVAE